MPSWHIRHNSTVFHAELKRGVLSQAGVAVRLRFVLQATRLYAFEFA